MDRLGTQVDPEVVSTVLSVALVPEKCLVASNQHHRSYPVHLWKQIGRRAVVILHLQLHADDQIVPAIGHCYLQNRPTESGNHHLDKKLREQLRDALREGNKRQVLRTGPSSTDFPT